MLSTPAGTTNVRSLPASLYVRVTVPPLACALAHGPASASTPRATVRHGTDVLNVAISLSLPRYECY